ncbi:MAG: NAD(P)-dependent oxidoreductase [Prochloraceae cyanobacterium]|nr:NAD(P)-dependent oxidoreductase [Prochloraceae cyanobacterium]
MKIAFLGTGLMGEPMAQKLIDAQLSLIVYNRTQSKLTALKAAGARIANTPSEAIKNSEIIILMLSNAAAIADVLLARDTLPLLKSRTVIQMGTIAPKQSKEISEQIVRNGGEYLEAPVLGSIPQVKSGELLVMVGSSPEQFTKYSPILKHFGPEPIHVGTVGKAAAMKLALNQLIAALTAAFSLSLSFVQKEGVEVDRFMEILRQSALYAPTFDKKISRMRDRNFENPNFPTKHLLKDTNLFLEEAGEIGLDTTGLEGIQKLIKKAIDNGFSDSDYSAIFAAINPQK